MDVVYNPALQRPLDILVEDGHRAATSRIHDERLLMEPVILGGNIDQGYLKSFIQRRRRAPTPEPVTVAVSSGLTSAAVTPASLNIFSVFCFCLSSFLSLKLVYLFT